MPTFFSLSRIIQRVDELLRPAMEKSFWVKAEISSSRAKGGHFYCDLVESNEKGLLVAQARCTIWSTELSAIRDKFKQEGLELKLEDGMNVGMLCRLQFHPVYGLSLRGIDMDPAFALGEMELKKRAIIERLKQKGLTDLNAEISLTLLPKRIGLITGDHTAAYEDFINTLRHSAFGFEVFFASTTMQGEATVKSLLKSLACLSKLKLDLIVICRGGGSKVDLSWLDDESLAEAIAHCKVPVWTGIGHEIDTSVLDVVAANAFKTPTAVAEELVSIFIGMQQWVNQSRHNLKSTWNYRFKAAQQTQENAGSQLKRQARHFLVLKSQALNYYREQLQSNAQHQLNEAASQLLALKDGLMRQVPKTLDLAESDLQDRALALKSCARRHLERLTQDRLQIKKRFQIKRFTTQLNQSRERLLLIHKRLSKGPVWNRLRRERDSLKSYAQILNSAAPQTQLKRGFSLVKNQAGQTLTRAEQLNHGQSLTLIFNDGAVRAVVESS